MLHRLPIHTVDMLVGRFYGGAVCLPASLAFVKVAARCAALRCDSALLNHRSGRRWVAVDRPLNVLAMFQDDLAAGLPLLPGLKLDIPEDVVVGEANRACVA